MASDLGRLAYTNPSMRGWFSVLALVLVSCEACDKGEAPPQVMDHDRLEFKMLTKEQTFDDCLAGADGCTYVRLDYPVLVDAPEGYAVTAVTESVFSSLTDNYGDEESYPSVETLMQAFIDEYRRLKEDQPSYEHAWFLERKVFVLHNTPEILSTSLSQHMFTGGAHGTATVTFSNLDPRTGEIVSLSDVLVDSYEARLLPLAEARFREVRSIEDGMSLTDAGFTLFENGVFALTDNFEIGEDGLTFYYNAYEVAPYALGSTEIVLSYDELNGLLKE